MKKAIFPLVLATIVGGCSPEKPKEIVPETLFIEAQVPDTSRNAVQRFLFEKMQEGWVTYSMNRYGEDTYYANRILPIDYEYNWKDVQDVDGVSVGIEGRVGPYLQVRKNGVVDAELDLEVFNYMPGAAQELLGNTLPEGYSLVTVSGWKRKPTTHELERMTRAFEKYVARTGEEIELGLTAEEMGILRLSMNDLKKIW